jgi:CTP:molybdopterin cytidylyltransferase MocA
VSHSLTAVGSMETDPSFVGLVLAAGEGRRLGLPKALVTGSDGTTWLGRAAAALVDGGAEKVYAVVGASAAEVRAAAPGFVEVVDAGDWQEGMGASLRAGLRAVSSAEPGTAAVMVVLVDTPGVGADVVRVIGACAAPGALIRASYEQTPGHPVLIGRDHWAGVIASARGDRGARDYISRHGIEEIECGQLGDGVDIDTPAALEAWRAGGGV